MVSAVLCNPDFEMHASGLSVAKGPAVQAAEACTRLMALCTPMGSRLFLAMGAQVTPRDGDALRRQGAARGLYREDRVAQAPWNAPGTQLVAYAHDARADALATQLGLAAPRLTAVTRDVNSKAFSLTHALAAGLEPGVFAHSLVVKSSDGLCTHLASVPAAVAQRWTLKPILGFAGGGRIAGKGRTPGNRVLHGLAAMLARDGCVVFEPWVDRVHDLSSQLWVDGKGEVSVLMQGGLFTTAAGRYVGNGSFVAPDDVRVAARQAALRAGQWLAEQRYEGPAGVDAFVYQDPTTSRTETRAVVEINARFTLGLMSGFVASMARPASEPWHFVLDLQETFGQWNWSSTAHAPPAPLEHATPDAPV